MGRLDGKVALITGGARGIGEAHARRFVAEGASVVIGDVLAEQGEKLATELGAAFVRMDVTSANDWDGAVRTTLHRYGGLDVLVNNAGVLRFRTIADMTEAELRSVLDVNLVGPWLGIKTVTEPMRANGGGSIVNTSSTEGYTGAAGLSAYSASKFAVRGVTKAAAQELGKLGIRVNSLHPGGIATPLVADPEVVEGTGVDAGEFLGRLPVPRYGRPDEVSGAAVFLASDESTYCTGTEILVDGGMVSGPGY